MGRPGRRGGRMGKLGGGRRDVHRIELYSNPKIQTRVFLPQHPCILPIVVKILFVLIILNDRIVK
jgi:hypothetical protein